MPHPRSQALKRQGPGTERRGGKHCEDAAMPAIDGGARRNPPVDLLNEIQQNVIKINTLLKALYRVLITASTVFIKRPALLGADLSAIKVYRGVSIYKVSGSRYRVECTGLLRSSITTHLR